jgi:hypothetical protein
MTTFTSFENWLAAFKGCFPGYGLLFIYNSEDYNINGKSVDGTGPDIDPKLLQARGIPIVFQLGYIHGSGKVLHDPMMFTTIDYSTSSMFRKTTETTEMSSVQVDESTPVAVAVQSENTLGDDWVVVNDDDDDDDGWKLV